MTEHTIQELRETTLLEERFYDILSTFRAVMALSSNGEDSSFSSCESGFDSP